MQINNEKVDIATAALSQARQAIDQAADALGVELANPDPGLSMNDALRNAGRDTTDEQAA